MRRYLIALASYFLVGSSLNASHIAGGEFYYRWLNGNNFELTLKLYRDCLTGQASFDASIVIGLFDKATNARTDTLLMKLIRVDSVQLSGPTADCAIPPEVCIETGVYIDTIFIADNPSGYYVSWERCCRNGAVVNLQSSSSTGFAFYMEMPDPALKNSSPVFSNDPLPFVCENQPLSYGFAATDADGDLLVYELADPLAGNLGFPVQPPQAIAVTPGPGPYSPVGWTPGYDLTNVCASSNNPLAVNAATGQVTVTVDFAGLYAMAIIVREFRGGIQIGMVRREIEFAVIFCASSLPYSGTSLDPGSGSGFPIASGGFDYEIYETDTLCFTYRAADNVDSLWLKVSSELFQPGTIIPPYATAAGDTGFTAVESAFCWKTVCGHSRATPYKAAFTVLDNGCPLPQTKFDTVRIRIKPPPVDDSLNLLCLGLQHNDSIKILWATTSAIPDRYFSRYEIFRSKNGSPFSVLAALSDPTQNNFTDITSSDIANNNYCYFIRAVSVCGVAGRNSDTLCSLTQFEDKRNYIKQVSVADDGKIEVSWKHFPDGPYSIFYLFRKEEAPGSKFELLATLPYPAYDSWIDHSAVTSGKSYCYYMINEDYCGNLSAESNHGCSILLTGRSIAYSNELSWTPYKEWDGGIKNYQIFRKPVEAGTYSALISFPDSNYFYFDNNLDLNSGRFNYYVKATEDTGGLDGESISNEIQLDQMPIGFLPSAFTPNGDGKNDIWQLHSSFIKEAQIRVYNRWGMVIFDSENKNFSWDGTFNSKPAPEGIYVYYLHYIGYDSEQPVTISGRISLIR